MDEIKTLLRLMLGMDGYIPSAKELLRKLPTLFPDWWIKIFIETLRHFLFSNRHLINSEIFLDSLRAYGTAEVPLG